MQGLIEKILEVQKETKVKVDKRIKEFEVINQKEDEEWFKELVFCILAANTSSKMASKITDNITTHEFLTLDEKKLKEKMQHYRCRFYNRRSEFIISARKSMPIKKILNKISDRNKKREYLVSNIKGIGLKEASHFLRNTGHYDFAILDKHVKNVLYENKIISLKLKEKSLIKTDYLKIEKKLQLIADKLKITQGELDFYIWYMKTGEILK